MKPVYMLIAQEDFERFAKVLSDCAKSMRATDTHLHALTQAAVNAVPVPAKDIPRNVVTLYSWVRLRMCDTGQEVTCRLVLPAEADRRRGYISLLSPVGSAILGQCVGQTLWLEGSSTARQITILGVFHKPHRYRERRLTAGVAG